MLDTARFRSLIAQELELDASQVKALILGENGDSMIPVWSSAVVGGFPLSGLKKVTPALQNERKRHRQPLCTESSMTDMMEGLS